MKNIIGIGTLALGLFGGCAPKEPSSDAVTFNMWNENWKRQATYQLMPGGEETLNELLSGEPDVNSTIPIALEPSGLLSHEGKRYAIERDQVVLFGDEGTKVWKRKGIRNALIKSSAKLEKQSK